MAKKGLGKGLFSGARLPVSRSYVYPANRNRLLLWGGGLALVVCLVLTGDIFFRDAGLISNGPLSSNHANFGKDCSSCHTEFGTVTDERCSVCHEKLGEDLGVYSFDAHYLYRSGDFTRVFRRDDESPCFACHSEHRGRDASITVVADSLCVTCHPYGSFNEGHPQFDVWAESLPDDGKLTFTHIQHVARVRERDQIDDVEGACLACHDADRDGRSFRPIDFDRHCGDCHLGARARTADLQIKDPDGPVVSEANGRATLQLGVETLETIRARQGPGEHWAATANPLEHRAGGGRVTKTAVYHQDPWILHNLALLRKAIYPSPGLAELLKASGQVGNGETRVLYEEAIETLKGYSAGLRGRPERSIQRELDRIDRTLAKVEKRVEDGSAPLDDSRFLLDDEENSALSREQIQEVADFAARVGEACLVCHEIRNATISRVQTKLGILRRAEFNHRAHILQRRCLDCHVEIPFLDYLDDPTSVPRGVDHAAIQNVPRIEQCQDCHAAELAGDRCSTCHAFHPNKESRSRLLLYRR